MNSNIFLTVLIPAYNEEQNLKATLEEVSKYLNEKKISHEVIIIDDGSVDNTSGIAQKFSKNFDKFKILRNDPNMGKGYALRRGMLAASGDYKLFMDADNSTSIYEFDKFLPYIKEDYDIVIASRRLKDSMVEESQPALRAAMGMVYILLSRLLLGTSFSDFNCGFKVYSNKAARLLFSKQKMNDWSFDTEVLFIAVKNHLKVKEVPVRWVHKSTSKVRPIRDGIKSFISLLRIKINDLRRLYEE